MVTLPLDIITKEDSADRISQLQGIDPKFYLTASELNTIVEAINFIYHNGTSGVGVTLLDIKQGLQTADHNGWIKLDGRSIDTLTESQIEVARTVFTDFLPNANDAFMTQNGLALGLVSGSNFKQIHQQHIPNYLLPLAYTNIVKHKHTGTTSENTHSHSIRTGASNENSSYDIVRGGKFWDSHAVDLNTGSNTHTHTLNVSEDEHNHFIQVGSGGEDLPFDITPKSMSVNVFIYLGL